MTVISTLVKNLRSNDIKLFLDADGKLKFDAPEGTVSGELKERLKTHKEEIIEYLKILVWRDFCGACHARLFESAGGWNCPTVGCTDARIGRAS